MDKADQDLLQQVSLADLRLKRMYQTHKKLEKQVEQYGKYAPYSASAALREAELKKEKLRNKEQMMAVLDEYRQRGPS